MIFACSHQTNKQVVELISEDKIKVHTVNLGTIVLEDEAAKKVVYFLEWGEIIDHPDLWSTGRFFKEALVEYDEYTAIYEEQVNPAELSEEEIDSTYFYSIDFSVSRDKKKYYMKYHETEDNKYLEKYLDIYDRKYMSMRIYGNRKQFKGIEQ